MAYELTQKVLFRHCDPAGIVFFPRYFEMMNDCVEAFFADVLRHPFEALHPGAAVPTAQIETRFAAPSRHGDHLRLSLQIARVGQSSAQYRMRAHCGAEMRFDTTATLVHVTREGRPDPWPDALRSALTEALDLGP